MNIDNLAFVILFGIISILGIVFYNKGRFIYYSLFFVIFTESFYGLPYIFHSFGNNDTGRMLGHIDEFVVIYGIIIFVIKLMQNRGMRMLEIDWLLLLLIIGLLFSGLMSEYFNVSRVLLGTFDIVKNLTLIWVFRFVRVDEREMDKLVRYFTIIMFIAIIVGVLQQLLTLSNIWIILKVKKSGVLTTPSFVGHTVFGLLCCVLFSIQFFKAEKSRIDNVVLCLSVVGVMLSTSRMAYAFLALFLLVYMIKYKRIGIAMFGTAILLICIIMFGFWKTYYDELKYLYNYPEGLLRTHAMERGVAIFYDNPMLGVGPGTYGAVVSFMTNSPVYKEYQFSKHWYEYSKSFKSLDSFIPQIIAETGIIGSILFFIVWFRVALYVEKQANKYNWFGKGLGMLLICILPLFGGAGLNLQIVTYCIWGMVGAYISYSLRVQGRLQGE